MESFLQDWTYIFNRLTNTQYFIEITAWQTWWFSTMVALWKDIIFIKLWSLIYETHNTRIWCGLQESEPGLAWPKSAFSWHSTYQLYYKCLLKKFTLVYQSSMQETGVLTVSTKKSGESILVSVIWIIAWACIWDQAFISCRTLNPPGL